MEVMVAMAEIILSAQMGLKGIMFYPVEVDSEDAYEVGPGFAVPAAQSSGAELDLREGQIDADDTVYADISEEKGATYTLTLAELPLALQAKVEGGTYDPTLKRYDFPNGTTRPTFAVREIIQFIKNQGWRVNYATHCEVLRVQMAGDSNTRGDSVEINAAQVLLYSKPRLCDGQRVVKYEPADQAELAAAEADFIKGVTATP